MEKNNHNSQTLKCSLSYSEAVTVNLYEVDKNFMDSLKDYPYHSRFFAVTAS